MSHLNHIKTVKLTGNTKFILNYVKLMNKYFFNLIGIGICNTLWLNSILNIFPNEWRQLELNPYFSTYYKK